jgi:AcrR family transcriptional regulator
MQEEKVSSVDSILDAAESVFAANGYAGTSMRSIADAAGVAQALLHYHFHTKERLFEATLERRSHPINQYRCGQLEALFTQKTKPKLLDVLKILIAPPHDPSTADASQKTDYLKIISVLAVADDPMSRALIARLYDPTATRFIEALQKVVPSFGQHEATCAYLFALGARMQANAPEARAKRLSGRSFDRATINSYLLSFVEGGIRNMANSARNSY